MGAHQRILARYVCSQNLILVVVLDLKLQNCLLFEKVVQKNTTNSSMLSSIFMCYQRRTILLLLYTPSDGLPWRWWVRDVSLGLY